MVMNKHTDKVAYFTEKARERRDEVERKLLTINPTSIEERLESLEGIEVFRGVVTSTYYNVDQETLARFFGIDPSMAGELSSFSRLRRMVDDDGTVLYLVETKVKGPKRGEYKVNTDWGGVVNPTAFDYIERFYRRFKVKQIETKRRIGCVTPGVDGLEYDLDHIVKVVSGDGKEYSNLGIDPYLEVEAASAEIYFKGVTLIGATPDDFVDVSAKDLIAKRLNELEA